MLIIPQRRFAATPRPQGDFDVEQYGALRHDPSRYPLFAVKTKGWVDGRPLVRQLRHHLGPFLTHFPATPPHTRRVMYCTFFTPPFFFGGVD